MNEPTGDSAKEHDPHLRRGPRGHSLLPGGLGRSTFAMGTPLPYAVRGDGYRIWDDRGRELVDLNNNFTTLIHGHAEPRVMEVAAAAMRAGSCFGLPNTYEWEHAEELLRRFPALDQVRYTNSGTEAVMTAVRIARAFTGRPGCVVFRDSYHGTSDLALTTGDQRLRRGVPEGVLQDIRVIGINDAGALEDAVERDGEKYAAIVIDLMPNRAGLVSVEPSLVQLARTLADRHGIVLVLDEVITFRLGPNGLGGHYGADPDVVALGKMIGGGFPVGAVLGKEKVMRELDPSSPHGLEHGGTFVANPVTMAAGAQALRLLTPEAVTRVNELGDLMRSLVAQKLTALNWEVRGRGSLLRPVPSGAGRVDKQLQRRLWWAAYDRGVLLTQHNVAALSTPMNEEVVHTVAERVADAAIAVSSGAA